jgi:neutral ceramidase
MPIKCHAAQVDITPKGFPDLSGYARRSGPTSGVHDPIFTRAVTLADGNNKVVISSNDLISFTRAYYLSMAAEIQKRTGASTANIACTHTHSAPATAPLRACGKRDLAYLAKLRKTVIANAVASSRQPEEVDIGIARAEADFAVNRRDKAGVLDRELLVLSLTKGNQRVATIVNYACHPVVLGSGNVFVSGDFGGYFQTKIEQSTGAPCLFLNGACGDVNPKVVETVDPADARRMGYALAEAALKAEKKSEAVQSTELRSGTIPLLLPFRRPKSGSEIERRHREVISAFHLPENLFTDRVASWKRQVERGTFPKEVHTQLSATALGSEVAVLFVPGELFAEIGLRIKAASPFRYTLISAFSNGTVGYLPTREAFRLGGYEPNLANFFYGYPEFDPGIEDIILDRAHRLLSKLAAG